MSESPRLQSTGRGRERRGAGLSSIRLLTSCGMVSLRRPKFKFDYKQSLCTAMAMNHAHWSTLFPRMHAAFLLQEEPRLPEGKGDCQLFKSLTMRLLTFIIQHDFKQEYSIFMGNYGFFL